MKNILFLNELKSQDDSTAKNALRLAYALRCDLILLCPFNEEGILKNISDDHGVCESFDLSRKELLLNIERQLKMLQPILDSSEGFRPQLQYLIKEGSIENSIAQIIKNDAVYMILIGTHHCMDFSNFLFGKYVNQIADQAKCPVLLIPSNALLGEVTNICYTTDTGMYNLENLKMLRNLAQKLNSNMSLLHVSADGLPCLKSDDAVSEFLEYISSPDKHPAINYHDFNGAENETTFNDVVEKEDIDILIMPHRKYHFFKFIFKAVLAKKLFNYNNIPVLIVPAYQ
ncbi:universal stress protein [Mucilaginibacter xinganensis]|nr:universal stress protein [Mucilaginibacter xinganensis]